MLSSPELCSLHQVAVSLKRWGSGQSGITVRRGPFRAPGSSGPPWPALQSSAGVPPMLPPAGWGSTRPPRRLLLARGRFRFPSPERLSPPPPGQRSARPVGTATPGGRGKTREEGKRSQSRNAVPGVGWGNSEKSLKTLDVLGLGVWVLSVRTAQTLRDFGP